MKYGLENLKINIPDDWDIWMKIKEGCAPMNIRAR
jgi:hypothetical protein